MPITLTTERSTLIAALSSAASTRDKNPTNPIGNAVLIEVAGDKAYVRANSQAGSTRICINGVGKGSACFNPETLIAWLKACDSSVVALNDAPGERIDVRCGKAERKVPCVDPDRFHLPPDADDAALAFKVPAPTLVAALESVEDGALSASHVYGLCVLFVECVDDVVYFITSDNSGLTRKAIKTPVSTQGSILIPIGSAAWIRKLNTGHDGDVSLHIGSRFIIVDSGDVVSTYRLAEGTPLPYRQAVFKDGKLLQNLHHVTANRSELIALITRASIINAENKNSTPQFLMEITDLETTFTASDSTSSTHEVASFGHGDGGVTLTVRFDSSVVLTALKSMDCETVRWGHWDTNKDNPKAWSFPSFITDPANPDSEDIVCVMPAAAGAGTGQEK